MAGVSLQIKRELLQSMIPQYREASSAKTKSKLLDAFTATTGYNRKYAMWLLNHAKEVQHLPQRPRPRHYGPEVQHTLLLVWHAANRICTKRLMPFLPTLIEAASAAWASSPHRGAERNWVLSRGASPIHPQDSLPCTRSRRVRANPVLAGCQSRTQQWRHLPRTAASFPRSISAVANPHRCFAGCAKYAPTRLGNLRGSVASRSDPWTSMRTSLVSRERSRYFLIIG